jgi:transmembrane sensor
MAEEPLLALPGRIQPEWTEERAAQVRAAIERRVRRRRATRWGVATSSIVLGGGLAFALLTRPKPAEVAVQKPAAVQSPVPRAKAAEPAATPLTADTELVVDPQGAGRAFVLRRGSARFVVSHDERHPFRVRVGPLVVEDLGTVFSVARLSEHEFNIGVEEGHVAVLCEGSRVELGGGQQRIFRCGESEKPPTAAVPPAAPSTAKAPAERPKVALDNAVVEPPPQTAPAWKLLAERGQYHEAYDSLRRASEPSVRDETHELLLAADTARLSGHASEAVPYLRRILVQHGNDPRAHLAAFTLGRVLLDELGRPAEAAAAFELARVPQAALGEDALAREIEAWARAGDVRRAHALALEYQRSYPQGRRLRAVTKFGGLEQ